MATFAKLDENNIVTNVIVVGDDVPETPGDKRYARMRRTYWWKGLFRGTWKQSSSSGTFRKQSAGIG